MLKLRLKRTGRKKQPSYRVVIMENKSRRDGRPVDEVGYYNPITKQFNLNVDKIVSWLKVGVQPTNAVLKLLKQAKIITT